ncbi:MAG: tRNA (adenosine(37)-N6)-threonylcarbamoyltransferase complex ATPase subunit type 1 TsaE [Actinomycetota bacterium]|nr:tRNA (adenosine(37)-N6)-threonylcarbamoyltransferase complex ATPase subunit type 1 TsaE [Actinomycetota bacterium]
MELGPVLGEAVSDSEERTEELGEALGSVLAAGDVVLLIGDLGAGKTAFTRGIARGLGITGRVTSPTFVIVRQYQGRLPLVHADLYRLEEGDAFAIDMLELGEAGYVTVIEWGDRSAGIFAVHDPLAVSVEVDRAQRRTIAFSGSADRWGGRLAAAGLSEVARGAGA